MDWLLAGKFDPTQGLARSWPTAEQTLRQDSGNWEKNQERKGNNITARILCITMLSTQTQTQYRRHYEEARIKGAFSLNKISINISQLCVFQERSNGTNMPLEDSFFCLNILTLSVCGWEVQRGPDWLLKEIIGNLSYCSSIWWSFHSRTHASQYHVKIAFDNKMTV